MAGIEKRLAQLERTRGGFGENVASGEVFQRMTTVDLLLLERWCERTGEEIGEPNEEEEAAIHRYEKLREAGSQRWA